GVDAGATCGVVGLPCCTNTAPCADPTASCISNGGSTRVCVAGPCGTAGHACCVPHACSDGSCCVSGDTDPIGSCIAEGARCNAYTIQGSSTPNFCMAGTCGGTCGAAPQGNCCRDIPALSGARHWCAAPGTVAYYYSDTMICNCNPCGGNGQACCSTADPK